MVNQDFSIVVLGLTFTNKLKKKQWWTKIYYVKIKSNIN